MFDFKRIPDEWAEVFEKAMDRLGLIDTDAESVFEELVGLEIERKMEAEEVFGRRAAECSVARFYIDDDQLCVQLEIDLNLVPIEKIHRAKIKCLGSYKLKEQSGTIH